LHKDYSAIRPALNITKNLPCINRGFSKWKKISFRKGFRDLPAAIYTLYYTLTIAQMLIWLDSPAGAGDRPPFWYSFGNLFKRTGIRERMPQRPEKTGKPDIENQKKGRFKIL
jgi:hypothetical protein